MNSAVVLRGGIDDYVLSVIYLAVEKVPNADREEWYDFFVAMTSQPN